MNPSETVFLLPPTSADADYRVRSFTLARKLPFARHATLGACHAWLAAGGEPAVPTGSYRRAEPGWRPSGGMDTAWRPPLLRCYARDQSMEGS